MILTSHEHQLIRKIYQDADQKRRVRQLVGQLLSAPATVSYRGYQKYLDPRDNYTDKVAMLTGDSPEQACLNTLVEIVRDKKALILDIGANSGTYSVPLAAVMAEGGRVIAYEPNPKMYQRLVHNLCLNQLESRVDAQNVAVGPENTSMVLNIHPNNLGQTSLAPLNVPAADHVRVPVVALRDQLQDVDKYELTLIKIDVEGFEAEVFRGFRDRVAKECRPNLILIESAWNKKWDYDLLAELMEIGYVNHLEANSNTLLELMS